MTRSRVPKRESGSGGLDRTGCSSTFVTRHEDRFRSYGSNGCARDGCCLEGAISRRLSRTRARPISGRGGGDRTVADSETERGARSRPKFRLGYQRIGILGGQALHCLGVAKGKMGKRLVMAQRPKPEQTTPQSLPNTSPPLTGTDLSTWLLSAVAKNTETLGRMDASVSGLQSQLDRIESKLVSIEAEVKGHGKWMHTLKVFSSAVALLIVWIFVNAVWPWLKLKLGLP
jgi:hypothetical protein